MNSITAFAPASVSNVGCGFDVFGFAIDGPGDEVTARLGKNGGVNISAIEGDGGELTSDSAENTAGIAVSELLKNVGRSDTSVDLVLHKNVPLNSGLGSSAASAAAAVTAVNRLLNLRLSPRQLLPFVIAAEKKVSGSAHADNAAPSLLGGFMLVRRAKEADVFRLPVPPNLYYAVVRPDVKVNTAQARAALPGSITLKNAVAQWADTAAVVHALHTRNLNLLARAVHDHVAEPVRAQFIPCYERVKKAALTNGALAVTISGSGPAMFAFCRGNHVARKVARAMAEVYEKEKTPSENYFGQIRSRGALITQQGEGA